jgi:hypothetical protein
MGSRGAASGTSGTRAAIGTRIPEEGSAEYAALRSSSEAYDNFSGSVLQATQLSPGERSALSDYTGEDYITINRSLLEERSPGPKTDAKIKNIDSALARSSTPEDMVVTRDLTTERVGGHGSSLVDGLRNGTIEPGAVISYKGYSSTTASKSFRAEKEVLRIQILVPKGSKALPLQALSESPNEREILLPRNSKFKIQRFEERPIKNGTRPTLYVTLEQ